MTETDSYQQAEDEARKWERSPEKNDFPDEAGWRMRFAPSYKGEPVRYSKTVWVSVTLEAAIIANDRARRDADVAATTLQDERRLVERIEYAMRMEGPNLPGSTYLRMAEAVAKNLRTGLAPFEGEQEGRS